MKIMNTQTMITLGKIAALGAATVAAASLTYFAVVPGMQAGNAGKRMTRRSRDREMIVCVGPNSMLRVGSGKGCPAGQTTLALLAAPEPPSNWGPQTPKQKPSPPQPPGSKPPAKRPKGVDKVAVFDVVDKAGKLILSVGRKEGLVVYNANETPVAAITATKEGGSFTSWSADGALEASIGALGTRAGIQIREAGEAGGVTRIDLGKKEAGNYSLTMPSSEGPIAGIGESQEGTGGVVVGDQEGSARAKMIVAGGKGMVGVLNNNGAAVLSLTEGATGGGLLAIGDANSEPMVKMGVKDNRYGGVFTGPGAGFPLVTGAGLPGSYFLGCAAGPACKPW